jgi:hypothetical protein
MADDVKFQITGDDSPFRAALQDASAAVDEIASAMQSKLGGIGELFTAATGGVAAFAAALGGGQIVEALTKISERATDISTWSQTLGISAEQFQVMSAAAEEAGVGQDQLARSTEKLSILLAEARQGNAAAIASLRSLGVTTAEIQDPNYTLIGLLGTLHDRLNDANTAAGTHAALIQAIGARAARVAEVYARLDLSLEGVARRLAELNGLSGEQVQQLQEQKGFWSQLGTEISNTWAQLELYVVNAAKAAAAQRQMQMSQAGFTGAGAPQEDPTAQQQTQWKTLQAVVLDVNGQITQASLEAMHAQLESDQGVTEARIALAQRYYAAAKEFYGSDTVSVVAAARAKMLELEKQYQSEVERLTQESAQMAAQAQARALQGHEQEVAILEKINADRIADAQQTAQEEIAIQEHALESQIEQIKAAAEAHKMTAKEEQAAIVAATNAELASVIALMQAEKSLFQEGSKDWKKLQQEMVTVSQAAGKQIETANATATKQQQQQWQWLSDSMKSSFASAIENMLEKGQSFGQAMRSVFMSLFNALIGAIARWVSEWITNLLLAKATSATTASAQAAGNAAAAAVAAMASVAAIPYVGWAMAPEVAAATYAEGMAYAGLASAAGGYDIPASVNPLIQAHARETVIPAPLAEAYRQGAKSLGDGGGQGSGGDIHIHQNVSAADGKSVAAMMRTPSYQKELQRAMRKAARRSGLR